WARLQIYLPLLADIAPAPELTGVAADAARHLYAGGKLREAGAWVTLIQQGQQANPDAAAALPELQALGDLAGNTAPLTPGTAPQPFMPKLAPDAPRAARLRALFNVLQQAQETSPTEPQVTLAADSPAPAMPQQNVNLWLDLGRAAEKGRV